MSVIDTIRDAYLSPPLPPTNENPGIDEMMPIEDARRHTIAWILSAVPAAVIIAAAPLADQMHPVLSMIACVSMLASLNSLFWVSYYVDLRRVYRRTRGYRDETRETRGDAG